MQSSNIDFDGPSSKKRKSEANNDGCSTTHSIVKGPFAASTPLSARLIGTGLIKEPFDNDPSMSMIHCDHLIQLPFEKTPISHAVQKNAKTPFTQLLVADNSDDETFEETLEGKQKCFYETLVLFKEHMQNRFSLVPVPNFNQKIASWKKSLEKNNLDPKQILKFVQTEMQALVEMLGAIPDDYSVQAKGMERLGNMFTIGSTNSDQEKLANNHDPQKKTGHRIEGVPKSKQTACRACKEYFVKTEEFNWICPKEKCQARKCKKCTEERVIQKNKTCCVPCSKAKK